MGKIIGIDLGTTNSSPSRLWYSSMNSHSSSSLCLANRDANSCFAAMVQPSTSARVGMAGIAP